LGIDRELSFNTIESCNVDLTPNLCPYIYYVSHASNILNISGFSGSGSMILDPHFINLVIDSVENNKLNSKLEPFQPSKSIIGNIFPPEIKQTPLSAII
jgi:hypothetical protein